MKRSGSQRRRVCMFCGKPSNQTICEACKAKVQGETLYRKLQTDKDGKRH